eukprot:m.75279 g.75279  ORF g.75279 m.75279 type:complete len:337 (-) comp12442_c0_seq2:1003-2013(-)
MAAASLYTNKLILAPMVRMGTLPSRLIALRYGAGLVYTEEIIDSKLALCTRVENPVLNTIDFVTSDGLVVFRTCAEEKDSVIFQMGTACPESAVNAAKMVQGDVAGIDVNMGCPKPFSVKGGMGAALLSTPAIAADILKAIVEAVDIPVTCKIRLLPTHEETVEFMHLMASTGISAIGLHGRFRPQRSGTPPHLDRMLQAVKACPIPVIANGCGPAPKNATEAREWGESVGCSSVMLARAAQRNLSIFRPEGPTSQIDVARELLKLSVQYDNDTVNTKYCVQKVMHGRLGNDFGQVSKTLHVYLAVEMPFSLTEFVSFWVFFATNFTCVFVSVNTV